MHSRLGNIKRVNISKATTILQVEQAEKHGAIGVILFSDPDDITSGDDDYKVYPNDWWLPPSGAQRGSIYIGVGDPETPGYPSISKNQLWLILTKRVENQRTERPRIVSTTQSLLKNQESVIIQYMY